MEVILFDQNADRVILDQVFPGDVRYTSSEFFGAFDDDGELQGVASLGYEQDTIILQYLFVPVKYRRNGAGKALLDDISERLAGNTDSFLEAYFDGYDDMESLTEFFRTRADFHLEEREGYAIAYWLGISEDMLIHLP